MTAIHSVQLLFNSINDCSILSTTKYGFSAIFKTPESANHFQTHLRNFLKTNHFWDQRCKPFLPSGYDSWEQYTVTYPNEKTLVIYNTRFQIETTARKFFSELAEYFKSRSSETEN